MSEETKETNPVNPTGYFDAYHPSGLKVRLPVLVPDYATAFTSIQAALNAGWLANAPGLEAGEHVDEIGYVVRKQIDKDGQITSVLDCYVNHDRMVHSFITIYLNTDEDVKAFEAVSGLQLARLPTYEGADKIERGKSRTTDMKVTRCTPFKLVWIDNPKWNKEEAEAAKAGGKMYSVPKKRFVRFDGPAAGKPAEAKGKTQESQGEPVDVQKVKEWSATLATDPSLDQLNQAVQGMASMNRATKVAVWQLVKEYAGAAGWVWDQDAKVWFQPDSNEDTDTIPF